MSKSLFACAALVLILATVSAGAAPKSTAPPILSPAEAQKHVDFKLAVPKAIPAGFQLVGVQVGVARSVKPSSKPSKPVKIFGYGIITTQHTKGSRVVLIASIPGSPAAKAGLPWQGANTLVSINGVAIESTAAGFEKVHELLGKATPPIELVCKESAGKLHTVTIAGKTHFSVPGRPTATVTFQPRAALLFQSKTGRFVVVESKAVHRGRFMFPGKPWMDKVGTTQVLFYNTKQAPNATFIRGGVEFDVAQPKGYVSEGEIRQMVGSM